MSSEAAVQAAVRAEYARRGYRLWRNNSGALLDSRGVPVRYGLANESAALNTRLKSSDLIGWRPVLVTPAMIGEQLAVFVSLEVKAAGWTPARSGQRYEHEQAQRRWLDLVTAGGGEARFIDSTDNNG